jgi:regulator of PEP synthase PpsR (kinase-PPPase family)
MMGAALTQFPTDATDVVFETFIRTPGRLQGALDKAAAQDAAVCHAIVSDADKLTITRFCKRRKLPCFDLTGGLSDFIGQITGAKRSANVAALHRLDDAYKRRIGAIEFTLAHDDGLGRETLGDADIVLVGVSRTSKTPTSIYLAQQGYCVANVALAIEVEPPAELLRLPADRVVGLLIDPRQLVMIRTHRERAWKLETGNYGDAEHVAQELAWARKLYQRQGWKHLDVTDQAIEETAARVLEMVKIRREPTAGDSFSNLE